MTDRVTAPGERDRPEPPLLKLLRWAQDVYSHMSLNERKARWGVDPSNYWRRIPDYELRALADLMDERAVALLREDEKEMAARPSYLGEHEAIFYWFVRQMTAAIRQLLAERRATENSAMIGNSAAKTYIEKADRLAAQLTDAEGKIARLRATVEQVADYFDPSIGSYDFTKRHGKIGASDLWKIAQETLAAIAPQEPT